MLGDDALREKRLAVGVVAAQDDVITLRVTPQKFLAALDPLTLRLFSRLRQQQDDTLQVRHDAVCCHAGTHKVCRAASAHGLRGCCTLGGGCRLLLPCCRGDEMLVGLTTADLQNALAAAAAAAAALGADLDLHQQQPAAASRLALLEDIFDSNIPSTLSRPSHSTGAAVHRPAWQSPRNKAASPGPGEAATSPRTARSARGKQDPPDSQLAAKGKKRVPGKNGGGDAGLLAEAQWEAQLPAGLKAEQCTGLPQTVSVRQLVEVNTYLVQAL